MRLTGGVRGYGTGGCVISDYLPRGRNIRICAEVNVGERLFTVTDEHQVPASKAAAGTVFADQGRVPAVHIHAVSTAEPQRF